MIELIGNEYIPEKTAVALGLFDGLHHGHRKVIAEILDKSAPTVFTFRTESIQYKHGKPLEYIYTNEQKLKILEKMGVKYVYSPDFDAVKDMDGEEFAKEILAGRLNAEYVVCGENFRFGKKALYDVTGQSFKLGIFKKKATDAPKRDLLEDLIHQAEDNIKINFE